MEAILKKKLRDYMILNNPDLIIWLQDENKIAQYMDEKVSAVMPVVSRLQSEGCPQYITEEICLDELTEDLRPSRFNYINGLLEEEFEIDYANLLEEGVLTYEVINMIEQSKQIFEKFEIQGSDEENEELKKNIIPVIQHYLIINKTQTQSLQKIL